MKKIILFVFFLNITICGMAQTAQDSVYKMYQTKKATYTKMNLGVPCGTDYEKPCKMYKEIIGKPILKYWGKIFKHLNYIYEHKIEDINKVDAFF